MRPLSVIPILCAGLAVLGCAQSASRSPLTESPLPDSAVLGGVSSAGGLSEAALGLWDLTVDPNSASATVALRETRAAAATDDLYLLSIGNFLRPDSLRVRQVRRDGAELVLTLDFTHPFAAPTNLGAPPSAVNRADLGIAGRIVLLADVPSATGNSYFTDGAPVVVNTALAANADAYLAPAGLLILGTVANTFPAWALVDESGSDGSRLTASNGGDPAGNYGVSGWHGLNMGSTLDQWAGYGVLHQGQTTRRELRLNLAALSGGPVSLPLAVLAKYNDPRGGTTGAEKKGNRLPPPGPDHTRFAYRMPHGSLDLERLTFLGTNGTFVEDEASSGLFAFHVVDWDATATETGLPDLATDPVVTNVAQGESGYPTLAICIPGFLGDPSVHVAFDPVLDLLNDDSLYGGDVDPDTGRPGDALCFARMINKPGGLGEAPGTYTGLVRAVDVEQNLDTSAWQFPLDPDLNLLPGNHPQPVAYQTFQVTVEPDAPARQPGWVYGIPGNTGTEYIYGLAVDSQNNTIISGYWSEGTSQVNFGGGPRPWGGASDLYIAKLGPTGTYLWDYSIAAAGAQQIVELAVDSNDNIYGGGFYGGSVNFGGGLRTSAGGNDVVLLKLSPAGVYQWDMVWGGTSGQDNTRGLCVDPSDNIILAGSYGATVDFGGGPRVAVGTADSMLIKVTPAGTYLWDFPISGPASDYMYAVASDASGNLYTSGFFGGTPNYGTGVLPNNGGNDVPVLKVSPAGSIIWAISYGGATSEWGWDIAVDPVSQGPVVSGMFASATINFGGGPVVNAGGEDAYAVKFTSSGSYVWHWVAAAVGVQNAYAVKVDAAGAVYAGGRFNNTVDFGGGPVASNGADDAYVVKLSPSGSFLWLSSWGGTSWDDVDELALGPNGTIRAAGTFLTVPVDFDPGPGTAILTPVGIDAYVSLLNTDDGLW